MNVGKEVGKNLIKHLDGLVNAAVEFPASSILVPTAIEIAGADVAHREVALRSAGDLDSVGILAQEHAPIDAWYGQRLVDQRLGVTTIVVETLQLGLVESDQ